MTCYYTLPDYSAILKQDDYDQLSHKAVRVIGKDRIDGLSPAQINLLNYSFGRLIASALNHDPPLGLVCIRLRS